MSAQHTPAPITLMHIAVLRATLDGQMPEGDPDALAKAMSDLVKHGLVAAVTRVPTDAGIAALEMVDALDAQWRERLGRIKAAYRVNLMRHLPKFDHETFDKHFAAIGAEVMG